MPVDTPLPSRGVANQAAADWRWLHRGFALFVRTSGRTLASLHPPAARTLRVERSPAGLHLAASFVQYLFERQGIERLRRFYRRADRMGVDPAARVAFGRSVFALEAEWEDMLRSLEI